ncbi:MAG: hypothetical protein KTR31_40805 [Myxococcales bacterium]|nr:hypothetical protein [Myxococcales bacterium]
MFTESHATQLFPTVVFQHRLEHADKLNRKFLRAITKEREAHPTWRGKTSPWQCTPDLHERTVFAPLVQAVERAVAVASEALHHQIDGHVITGMWATWLRAGEFHPPHTHSNNFWSGVYWVRNDEPATASITFTNPNPAAGAILPRLSRNTMSNSQTWSFEAHPGVLLLFPSWLSHHVNPLGEGDRVSVAFNVMLRGDLQTPDSLQFAHIG